MPALGDKLKRTKTMPFGKKFVQKFGKTETVEVSVANIEDAIVAWLYSVKAIRETKDVLQINWQDLVNKKPTDTVKVALTVKKPNKLPM